MPRIRSIKPSFFKSDDVSALPLRARLTWVGLWTQCDDQGRTKDHVKLIKADVWPLDPVSLADIEEDLAELARRGRIVRYEVAGERYLEVTNWSRHQKINRPTASHIPAPSGSSVNGHAPLTEPTVSTHAGKGGERKGKEGTRDARASDESPATAIPTEPGPEPPRQCPKHLDDPDPPPCGPCADARRSRARWEAERAARIAAAPKCHLHRGQPASNCAICASERKAAS